MLEKARYYWNDGRWMELWEPMAANLLLSLLIFVIGLWLASRFVKLMDKLMELRGVDRALSSFLCMILGMVLKFAVLLIALEQMGVDTTSLLALFGAASLAVGLALKDSLANFASGIMLIVMQPFKAGDFIEAAGVSAFVEKITVFNTILRTGDNREVTVPNSQIFGGTITNFSACSSRRIDLTIGISYDDKIQQARGVILEVVARDPRIMLEPAPQVVVSELAESSVDLLVRIWVKSEEYWPVRWELLENLKSSFETSGITIPYPRRDFYIHNIEQGK